MSLASLFREEPSPDEEQIRDHVQGHLCRCTGYQQLVQAALAESDRNAASDGAARGAQVAR
jgi:aerobic-type carbon monoxide dehydrogenase small subunit (CoxS/CutS family)